MNTFKGVMWGTLFSLVFWIPMLFISCGDEITQVTVEQNPPPPIPPVIRCDPSPTIYVPTLPPEEQEIDGAQSMQDNTEC